MKLSMYLLGVLAVLGGLFLFFRPHSASPPSITVAERAQPAPATPQPAASAPPQAVAVAPQQAVAPAPPSPEIFDLVIRQGRLVSGPTVIKVHQGDDVILHLTSDAADELHLHGYDLHAKTRPGETVTLQFNATRTGRFGYELHHANAELGALEVYPR
jgi:hypothetical protein